MKLPEHRASIKTLEMSQPNTAPPLLCPPLHLAQRVYPITFSPNGDYLAVGSQDFAVRVFKSPFLANEPQSPAAPTPYATFRLPQTRSPRWTISDVTINDATSFIAFSAMSSSSIALGPLSASASPEVDDSLLFDIPTGPVWRDPLGQTGTTAHLANWGLLSLRFMHGARASSLVAGLTDNGIVVVDADAVGSDDDEHLARGVRKISDAHTDEVNAVHPLSGTSSDLILSGGDDGLVKMWDLRTDTAAAVGVLCGHRAGVTSVDATSDGKGAVSVGKDQCVKVWDLRHMGAPSAVLVDDVTEAEMFDYRFQDCPAGLMSQVEGDMSVRTLRDGHAPRSLENDQKDGEPVGEGDVSDLKVKYTLIKARYWPADERFVAVGSADGRARVWNVHSGELVQRWNVSDGQGEQSRKSWVVRDVSWHPTDPVLATGWWGRPKANRWSEELQGNRAVGGMSVYELKGYLGEDEDWVDVR